MSGFADGGYVRRPVKPGDRITWGSGDTSWVVAAITDRMISFEPGSGRLERTGKSWGVEAHTPISESLPSIRVVESAKDGPRFKVGDDVWFYCPDGKSGPFAGVGVIEEWYNKRYVIRTKDREKWSIPESQVFPSRSASASQRDGWIDHDGGPYPVTLDTWVEVRGAGLTFDPNPLPAGKVNWAYVDQYRVFTGKTPDEPSSPRFKVGEHVRVKTGFLNHGIQPGSEDVIKSIDRDMTMDAPYRGQTGAWYKADEIERVDGSAQPEPSGPVRTVTRKEIVPGIYGSIQVLNTPEEGQDRITLRWGNRQSWVDVGPDELRAAAIVFTELADALEDEQ